MWRGGDVSPGDAVDVENVADSFLGLAIIGFMVTSILFIIWFFMAYNAAKSRGARGTTWAVGWTIGSWFIPFANRVVPKLAMNEVDRMSNPNTGEPPIEQRWKQVRRLVVSNLWWVTLLIAIGAQLVAWVIFAFATYADDAYGAGLFLVSAWSLLLAVSGVLLGATTFTIGNRLRP